MSERPPNLALVTVDSLRADHCGFLGGDRSLTPYLDDLAGDATVFEDAITPGPRTPSAMPAIVSGVPRAPIREQHPSWSKRWDGIDAHLRRYGTVAERLSERGYTTIGISTNPWTADTGFERGFDRFHDLDDLEGRASTSESLLWRLEEWTRAGRVNDYLDLVNTGQWFLQWEDYYDLVRAELAAADPPVFLWVFLLDTHQPYIVPKRFRRESSALGMYYATAREVLADDHDALPDHVLRRLQRAYRDSVRSVDAFVERLHGEPELRDATVAVHSDHGEAFGEHGTVGHEPELYRENVHVPLLVHGPDVPAGRVADPVSLCRLPAMLESLADGRGLAAADHTSPFVVAASEFGDPECVYGEGWKLIRSTEGNELYHVASDPGERNDLGTARPDVAEALSAYLSHERAPTLERTRVREAVEDLGVLL